MASPSYLTMMKWCQTNHFYDLTVSEQLEIFTIVSVHLIVDSWSYLVCFGKLYSLWRGNNTACFRSSPMCMCIVLQLTCCLYSHQDGNTIIHYAARGGHLECLKYLMDKTSLLVDDRNNVCL